MDFNSLTRFLVSPERLKRAQQIADNEVRIIKETEDEIEATVRDYHIIVDTKNKNLVHDCADWGKIMSTKRLCKHIAKLLSMIDQQKATDVLRSIYEKEESWNFENYRE
jgi:hypothetical protein